MPYTEKERRNSYGPLVFGSQSMVLSRKAWLAVFGVRRRRRRSRETGSVFVGGVVVSL